MDEFDESDYHVGKVTSQTLQVPERMNKRYSAATVEELRQSTMVCGGVRTTDGCTGKMEEEGGLGACSHGTKSPNRIQFKQLSMLGLRKEAIARKCRSAMPTPRHSKSEHMVTAELEVRA